MHCRATITVGPQSPAQRLLRRVDLPPLFSGDAYSRGVGIIRAASRRRTAFRCQAMQAAQAVGGLIHISETWIMAGSAALALSVPVAFGAVRQGRTQTVSPSEASILLRSGTNIKLVDVRSRLEVKIEGLPLKRNARKARVIHAPFNELRDGKLVPSPSFLDDLLFSPGVDQDTAFIVLSSRGSETCRKAAKAISSLGDHHDVYMVAGGFRAWQALGMDTEPAAVLSDGDGSAEDELEEYYGGLYDRAVRQGGQQAGSGSGGSGLVPGGAARGVEEVFLDSSDAGGPLAWLARVPFKPKLLEVLKQGYTTDDLRRDVMSGLVVGVIALALGMALGIASDSTPAVGVYTVVVGGFLASALSGSRVTVVGPTAAFIPIVAGVAHQHGFGGLVACTGLAGLMLIGMGVTGMGGIIRYVPKPVVTGFTAGIATYIFGTQIKDFLGLGAPGRLPEGVPVPTEFLEKVVYLGSHLDSAHLPSVAMGLGCLVLIKTWPKNWGKVLPTPIVAIAAGTLGLQLLQMWHPGVDLGIETIGSHFGAGAIPRSLPSLQWPEGFSPSELPSLLYPAATIAMLAAIESLLCARVADTMIGDKHDSNTELISQGIANLGCAAFGCLPATGALARTAANIRAGGRSPVSGLVHAAVVAAVILAAAPAAEYIPLPALSAVLVVVALNMGEWHNFEQLPKWPQNDAHLFLIAFSLTVLQDVAVAVAFGMVIALAVFVQDVSATMYVRALPPRSVITPPDHDPAAGLLGGEDDEGAAEPYRRPSPLAAVVARSASSSRAASGDEEEEAVEGPLPVAAAAAARGGAGGVLTAGGLRAVVPAGTVYVEVTGSLLFGAGEVLERAVENTHSQDPIQVLVLNMSHVSVVDVSGLEVLEEAHRRLHQAGKTLVLCGLTRQPLRMMARAGFLDTAGRANVCRNVEAALSRAAAIVAAKRAEDEAASHSHSHHHNANGNNGHNSHNGHDHHHKEGKKKQQYVTVAATAAAAAVASDSPSSFGGFVDGYRPSQDCEVSSSGDDCEVGALWASAAVPYDDVARVASGSRSSATNGFSLTAAKEHQQGAHQPLSRLQPQYIPGGGSLEADPCSEEPGATA